MASTVTEDVINKHRFNGDLYHALMRQDKEQVIELCLKVPEGALHVLTIHSDTVLHMAAYSGQEHLLLRLLQELQKVLPEDHLKNKMTHQNDNGNTILHEAAATVQDRSVAEKMLCIMPPVLLSMRNLLGETAIFTAAYYGNTLMFNFLADKVSEYNEADREAFLQRNDKTTIFHISILAE